MNADRLSRLGCKDLKQYTRIKKRESSPSRREVFTKLEQGALAGEEVGMPPFLPNRDFVHAVGTQRNIPGIPRSAWYMGLVQEQGLWY